MQIANEGLGGNRGYANGFWSVSDSFVRSMRVTSRGDGVKIAPSTHIGHNNVVGKDTTIICSNLFGSVHTGSNSYITASTVQNQLSVGNHTMIGMGSIVRNCN